MEDRLPLLPATRWQSDSEWSLVYFSKRMHLLHRTHLSASGDDQNIPTGLYSKLEAPVWFNSGIRYRRRKDPHHSCPQRLLGVFGHESHPTLKSRQILGHGKFFWRQIR